MAKPIGPACGNNPNFQMSDGDRKAVDDFKARLALKEAAKPYIERAAWVDFDPLMEVIAATVWGHCARDSEDMPQLVCDDPRTIAAFAAAVARALPAVSSAVPETAPQAVLLGAAEIKTHPVLNVTRLPAEALDTDEAFVDRDAFRAAVLREAADAIDRKDADQGYPEDGVGWATGELRRMADEAQQPETQTDDKPPVCEGFQWIGQPFTTCDRCGQPAWDHVGQDVPVDGAGPFDTRRTVRPWELGEADRIRAKWGTPDDEPAVVQTSEDA